MNLVPLNTQRMKLILPNHNNMQYNRHYRTLIKQYDCVQKLSIL